MQMFANKLPARSLSPSFPLEYFIETFLRWFLSIALRIPTAHDFCVISARKLARARTQRNKFPQAKLDREINVRFLLNEHGDLYFLLHKNSVRIIFLNLKEN